MKTNKRFITAGVLALALILGLTAAACSKTDAQAGGSGGEASAQASGSGSGGAASAKSGKSDKANPATDFSFDLTADGKGILIKGYTGEPGKVVIPAKIEDIPVVEIGAGVFGDKRKITAIIIPDTVKKIGTRAFAETGITSIVIPDSVTEIGFYLFDDCEELTEIKFSDSLETIPDIIYFSSLTALKKSNLPKNLKRIADGSFTGCRELIELIIPDTLTTVEFGRFDGNGEWHKDPEETYYDGTTVGDRAFKGCGKLPLKTRQRLQELGYTGEF
jgi:hypothetical protein